MKEIEIDIHFGAFGESCSDADHWINMAIDGKCFRCMTGLAPFAPELPKLEPPSDEEIEAMAHLAGAGCYQCERDGQPCEEHSKVETESQAYRTAN